MFAAAALTSLRPAAVPKCRKPVGSARRARVAAPPRAMLTPQLIAQVAETAPGSVDAPVGAVVIGAIVVTALSFAVSAGLKSGTDAASEMQKRDAKKFNKYDK